MVGFEVEGGDDLVWGIDFRSSHATFGREESEAVGEGGHFVLEFWGRICWADLAGLHGVEAHDVGFLNHAGESSMRGACIGGDDDASFIGFGLQLEADGDIYEGIGEDEVGVV